MRSRSSSLEDVLKAELGQRMEARKRSAERGEPSGRAERRGRIREPPDDTGTVKRNHRACRNGNKNENGTGNAEGTAKADRRENGRDLSRDDLIFLLSLLEGELQARDEVITVLKADKLDVALLEAKYGFVTPQNVLQALQRDAIQGEVNVLQEDIYEKPMEELDKLVEKQRETHGRMLEQLLLAEQAHQQALSKLEDEKRNHGEFVRKSDEFTNLLEQERERLKLLVDQERSYRERKELESERKLAALREELTKLKSFALMLVEERQRLQARVQEAGAQEELTSTHARLREEQQKVVRLEAELRDQSARHQQEQDAMAAKLSGEDAHNRRLDELEEGNRTLRRTEEELQEPRGEVSRDEGEGGDAGLAAEVEELRRRVLEMEGKDGELLRMEELCGELSKKLETEASQSQSLKVEVESLNLRILEVEKLEDAFGKSKRECSALRSNLEKERAASTVLSSELELLKIRVKELEAAESQLGKTELALREDLTKLRTLALALVDERKAAAEKLKQMENKEERVTCVTERLMEESRRALKSRAELEEKMHGVLKEKEELEAKLTEEEEKNGDLESKISQMKERMCSLENTGGERGRNSPKEERIKAPSYNQEDNQVLDLTQEVERLRRKLKEMMVMEGDLLKPQQLLSLEKRLSSEQEKANVLTAELEASRRELSKRRLAEKTEGHQEHLLYRRLREEEAKSSRLSRELQALKEKVQQCAGAEESACRARSDHATLQKKLTQQEVRNRELSREMEGLSRELERYRRFSRSLRPGMTGRRFSDLHLSTKEVQTELTAAAPECGVLNGGLCKEGKADGGAGYGEAPLLNGANDLTDAQVPFLSSKDSAHQSQGKAQVWQNGEQAQHGDVVLTQSCGQPLHIKVRPDRGLNTATLQISSPGGESAPSFTSTAVIATSGGPPKQRITIIQNAKSEPPSPDRARSPFVTAASSRALTPNSCGPDRAASPAQVVSVATGAPDRALTAEPAEVAGVRAVIRLSPDRPSWQVQRSNSAGPSVFTTEDNKIHIHLGGPFVQRVGVPTSPALRTQPAGVHGRMSSSILIKPSSGPLQRPLQAPIPLEAFRRPGPTRIPKPKGCGFQKVTNGTAANTQSKSPPMTRKEPPVHNNNPHLVNRRL